MIISKDNDTLYSTCKIKKKILFRIEKEGKKITLFGKKQRKKDHFTENNQRPQGYW
jgi:hypothetical protein